MRDKKSQLTLEVVESLLKKCPNIMRVEMINKEKSEVLSLIGRYCPRLKALTYYPVYNVNALLFFQSYGQTLDELNLFHSIEQFEQILRLCPNLKRIRLPDTYVHWQEDNEFLPKLEELSNCVIREEKYEQYYCIVG